jgi:hypothetical protein
MRTKNHVVIALTTAVALTLTLAVSSVAAGGRTFNLALSSAEEVPVPTDEATGTAWLQINPGQREVCFEISWAGVTDAAGAAATVLAAHIHVGPVGEAGPVVVPLFTTPQMSDENGDGSTAGCVTSDLTARELAQILAHPSAYYVNVHSSANPAGAIRAQLG